MIKQLKKAFSLAEILIALAIISVIATMGFTITKKNIESAYDMYFYTGYTGLYNAIADANDKGKDYTTNFEDFIVHIVDLFRGEKTKNSSTKYTITAPNHIKYIISKQSNGALQIIMQVPTVKTKDSSNAEVTMYYYPEKYNFLILTGDYATKRIDLFPFYIDDGIAGKSIQHCEPNADSTPLTDCKLISTPTYAKRKYYTFRDAYCRAYNDEILRISSTEPLGACPYRYPQEDEKGAIKLANPKKVF